MTINFDSRRTIRAIPYY